MAVTEIVVRPAHEADVEAFTAIHQASWRAAYEGIVREAVIVADADRRRAAWSGYVAEPPTPAHRAHVATLRRQTVGFTAFGPSRDADAKDGKTGEIYAAYVTPHVWRQGVGRRLLAEAERVLRADGFTDATLWVLDTNLRARAFYEAAGWAADGAEKSDSLHGTEVREVRYRRAVPGG